MSRVMEFIESRISEDSKEVSRSISTLNGEDNFRTFIIRERET